MEAFKRLYDTIVRLRAPGGCAWDREQTPLSLRGALIEETYECVEAIDEQDGEHIKEELGDIFLLVTMIAYMHEQRGIFSVADALNANVEKLIRRHPHVFDAAQNGGGKTAEQMTAEQTLEKWAQIKIEKEGRAPKDSVLDEVRGGFPPLDKAYKLQKKAARAGFDWQNAADTIAKIREELEEVEQAIADCGKEKSAAANAANANAPNAASAHEANAYAALEGELGDLLFSAVNVCRVYKVDPSVALQRTNVKFTERFKYVEKRMKETAQAMNPQNLAAMDSFWNEAKKGK